MSLTVKETDDGYEITIVLKVKHWIDLVAEIKQFFKLRPEDSQEN